MLDFIVWNADPVLFHIGNFSLRWYSLAFMVGFLIGYEIEARIYKHEGAPERWLGVLLLWTMAGTIIGARLGHVFFTSGTNTARIRSQSYTYGRVALQATVAQ